MIIEQIVKSIDLESMSFIDENGMIQPIKHSNAYLVPIKDGSKQHSRYVTDKLGVISKQSDKGINKENEQNNVFLLITATLNDLNVETHSQVTAGLVSSYLAGLNLNISETELLLFEITDNI